MARLPDWEDEDAASFEPVLDALDLLTPYVEVLGPGCAAMPLRRLAGDEAAFCERLIDTVAGLVDRDCQTGVADGLLAAALAARSGRIVRPGRDAEFLAPFDIAALRHTGLVDAGTCETLRRLGIDTLGAFAALPAAAVAERFGAAARRARSLAAGGGARPLVPRRTPPEFTVAVEAEEPYETVEQAAFAARPLAERLLADLGRRNLTCTRVTVTARTAGGRVRERTWQFDPAGPATELARRVRWQLEGWLSGEEADALSALELAADGMLGLVDAGRGLWDSKDAATVRAEAALRHAQGLLGPDAVVLATETDGRDLHERCRLVPWGAGSALARSGPWPGALPDPLPALTGTDEPVAVLDAAGVPVSAPARGGLSAVPALVSLGDRRVPVIAWAGPWPVVERWWDPQTARRYTRLQVVLGDGRAALLHAEHRRWRIAGWYD
ncbi:DNA polymerase Y subunit UmuC family protein [Glycomyces xiaoerkulensis]|uniref:DNA repair protein n=1 Tax=Glycomyces xiaoerkulensis TaxID=2038139 RepID=UPI000C257891|nr:DNA repair protein [Glycomyces xiaoerkulensis]